MLGLLRWRGRGDRRGGSAAVRAAWRRFLLAAALLSAIKIVLYTVGTTLFLAREGVESLPAFYVLLALVAILASTWLTAIVDQVPRFALFRTFLLLTAASVLALRAAVTAEAPGVYYAALVSAHLFDIASDIVFWVLAGARFDNLELKRWTAHFYSAIAAGGAAAGLAADRLSGVIAPENILLGLPLLALAAHLAMRGEAAALTQTELGAGGYDEATEEGPIRALASLPGLVARHPFILLLALNGLLLTVVYGLTEYVVFAVYSAHFVEEAELAGFLARIFAAIQLLELAVLLTVSGRVVERMGPVLRNLAFPLTSLGCLLALLAGQRLPAAILAHLNTEAVSNAIFEPVNAANYAALPPAVHGRARTLADGIFYPAGLALAGLGIAVIEADAAVYLATVLAAIACGLFVLTNAGTGFYFLPTLILSLRGGIADVTGRGRVHARRPPATVAGAPPDLVLLLLSADPVEREAALAMLPALDPAAFAELLPDIAERIDPERRGRLAQFAARDTHWPPVARLDRGDPALAEIRLRAGIIRGGSELPVTFDAADPVMAGLITMAAENWHEGGVPPSWLAIPAAVAAVLETAEAGGQARHRRLIRLILEKGPEAMRVRALEVALTLGDTGHPRVRAEARQAAESRDTGLRRLGLELIAASPEADEDRLVTGLDDPAGEVRGAAARLLAERGEGAVPALEARLERPGQAGRLAAIEALGAMDRAWGRRVLLTFLTHLGEAAAANLSLHAAMPRNGGASFATKAFETALEDSDLRLLELVFATLVALGETPRAPQLRQVLDHLSRRERAAAIDGFLALRHRRLIRPFLPLLEATFLDRPSPDASPPPPAASRARLPAELLQEARAHHDPRVRQAAELATEPEPCISKVRNATLQQLLLLKRHALLRHLPLDTLEALLPFLDRRAYPAGARILGRQQRLDHLWLVTSGSLLVSRTGGNADRLVAGDEFGETALADELTPAPEVTAETDCEVMRLHRIVFQDLAREHPGLSTALCHLLAMRLRHLEAAPPRPRASLTALEDAG